MLNTIEYKDIINRIHKWRSDRNMTLDHQIKGFENNLMEEYNEYLSSYVNEERIDALCDMFIIAVNAEKDSWNIFGVDIKSLNDIITLISYLGYKPIECITEAIKHIESRTGSYSEEKKKWIKDKGAVDVSEATKLALKDNNNYRYYYEDTKYWYYRIEDNIATEIKILKWYKPNYNGHRI